MVQVYFRPIFDLALKRLQSNKKVSPHVVTAWAIFVARYGCNAFKGQLEAIQQGLFLQVMRIYLFVCCKLCSRHLSHSSLPSLSLVFAAHDYCSCCARSCARSGRSTRRPCKALRARLCDSPMPAPTSALLHPLGTAPSKHHVESSYRDRSDHHCRDQLVDDTCIYRRKHTASIKSHE